MNLVDKILPHLQWIIITLGLVGPVTHCFYDWPLSGIGSWAYLIYVIVAVGGVFIYGAFSFTGFAAFFAGLGLAVLMIILDVIAYFFPSFINAGKILGYDMSAEYRLLAGVTTAVVLGFISFIIGRFLIGIGGDKDNWVWKAKNTPFILKIGAALSSIFCIVLLGINIYASRMAIWEVLSDIFIFVWIAAMLYLVYRFLGFPVSSALKCPYCGSFHVTATERLAVVSFWCKDCNGSW